MFCNYLNNIYLEHIHPHLLDDELIYSAEVWETFLDVWGSVTDIKQLPKYNNSNYYFRDDKILFEVYLEENEMIGFTFDVFEIYLPFRDKYYIEYYTIISIIKYIGENILFKKIYLCTYATNNAYMEKKFLENAL
jgi:hypothetical protein